MTSSPIQFLTVKWGTKYGPDYVNILYDAVRRNMPRDMPWHFICFTEDAAALAPEIETRALPGNLKGWWNKLYLFSESLFPTGTRIIFLDLDTLITGDIGGIARYAGEFAILRDFYRHNGYGSGVMLWRSGFGANIWKSFIEAGSPEIEGGDQAWIERCISRADILQDLFPDAIVSFKERCQISLPADAKIVCFHGLPRPHEIRNGWVENVWKIGGEIGKSAAPENPAARATLENIRKTMMLPYPHLTVAQTPSTQPACIVGSGPSAAKHIHDIKAQQAQGHAIWAINGAYPMLAERGITPNMHVIFGTGTEQAKFVPEKTTATLLYASCCHPDVFARAAKASEKIIIWHPSIDSIRNIVQRPGAVFVSGGATAGLKALALAYISGFKTMHLYGFDSSLTPGAAANDPNLIRVNVAGQVFESFPALAEQFNGLCLLMQQLAPQGVKLSLHGDGLLPHLMQKVKTMN